MMRSAAVSVRSFNECKTFNSYFGEDLQQISYRDHSDIPSLITSICESLYRSGGLETEGIFRINGNNRIIEDNKAAITVASPYQIPEIINKLDAHTSANLFKLYLREIPDGLIPREYTQKFVQAFVSCSNSLNLLIDLEQLLTHLPLINYRILQYVCRFLNQVHLNAFKTKMTAQSLGIIFGPCFFTLDLKFYVNKSHHMNENYTSSHPNTEEMKAYNHQNVLNKITEMLIENAPRLFRYQPRQDSKYSDLTASRNNVTRASINGPIPKPRHSITNSMSPTKYNYSSSTDSSHSMDHNWNVSPYANDSYIHSHKIYEDRDVLSDPEFATPVNERLLNNTSPPQLFANTYSHPQIDDQEFQLSDLLLTNNNSANLPYQPSHRRQAMTAHNYIQRRIGEAVMQYALPSASKKPSSLTVVPSIQTPQLSKDGSSRVTSIAKFKLHHNKQGKEAQKDPIQEPMSKGQNGFTKTSESAPMTRTSRQRESSSELHKSPRPNNAQQIHPQKSPESISKFRNEISSKNAMMDSDNNVERGCLELACMSIERNLEERRSFAKRPENLEDMTLKQLEAEKLALQKALINFESQHGRPKSHEERTIMRPLYNRYRNIKRKLAENNCPGTNEVNESLGNTNLTRLHTRDSPSASLERKQPEEWFGSGRVKSGDRMTGVLSQSTHALHNSSQETLVLFNTIDSQRSLHMENSTKHIYHNYPKQKAFLNERKNNTKNDHKSTFATNERNEQSNARTSLEHLHKSPHNSVCRNSSRNAQCPDREMDNQCEIIERYKGVPLGELRTKLEKVSESKRSLQRKLKSFEHAVEAQTGSKITANDRSQMKADYEAYRVLKRDLKELQSAVQLREQILAP